jgi:hypothetical protein
LLEGASSETPLKIRKRGEEKKTWNVMCFNNIVKNKNK